MSDTTRYRAFISYSHSDRRWADWLHRALESYRPPRGTGAGRLRPIFRDSAELSAGPDLGFAIRAAIDRSDHLIVICSPAASASRWVAQELDQFLERRSVRDVFFVIVAGPPGDLRDCLPARARDALPPQAEPLAIDLRPNRDGRRLGRLKLAAGMLGVDLDRLVQRDARRRIRWMAALTAAATMLSVVLGALTVTAIDARRLALRRSAESEDLVAFMLGDLRGKLEPVGRLDVLDGVARKVLAHYERIDPAGLDDAALAQQARASTLLGSIGVQRGELHDAERAFARAATASAALSLRAPGSGDRLFDHAQNVYWLAFVQWRLDNLRRAERGFADYARLADTLVRLDPARADWRLEPAYARSNLGTLLLEQGRTAEALAAFEAAHAVFLAASRRAPDDEGRLADLVDAQNWVADAHFRLGRLREAYRDRAAAAALLHAALSRDLGNRLLEAQALAADLALARRALDLGQVGESRDIVARSRAALARLVSYDPANTSWREFAVFGDLDASDIAMARGDRAAAWAAHADAARNIAALRRRAGQSYRWRPQIDGRAQRQALSLRRSSGDRQGSLRDARSLLSQVSMPQRWKEPGEIAALAGAAENALGNREAARGRLEARAALLPPEGRDLLARLLLEGGDTVRADNIVQGLHASGYRHPSFLAFWQDHRLTSAAIKRGSE